MGSVHVAAAVSGLILGAVVASIPKGTSLHRILGACYAILLLVVNVAALSIPRSGDGIGPFQILALVSLGTLCAGLVPMWLTMRTAKVVAIHAITMSFSYVGLVAAGLSQIAAQRLPDHVAGAVLAVSTLTFVIGGYVIFTQVPQTLANRER